MNFQQKMALGLMTGGGAGGFGGGAFGLGGGDDDQGVISQIKNACSPAPPPEEPEEEIEDDDAAPMPESEIRKYFLRICVHSAEGLARETSYVKVIVGEGTEKEISLKSETVPSATEAPTWEFVFEKDITVDGSAPDCEIQIWGSRILGDMALGACKLVLPDCPTDGPKRQNLKITQPQPMVSQMLGMAPPVPPKILVVWQLVEENNSYLPDLVRVAEMDSMCTFKKNWNFDIKLYHLKLKKGSKHSSQYKATFSLVDRTGKRVYPPGDLEPIPEKPSRVDPCKKRPAQAVGQRDSNASTQDRSKESKDIVMWGEKSDEFYQLQKWIYNCSHVNLLSHFIRITVLCREDPDEIATPTKHIGNTKWVKHGAWEDKVADLLDKLDEEDHTLYFDALIMAHSNTSQSVGRMRLEIDVYKGSSSHKRNDKLWQAQKMGDTAIQASVPSRIGWQRFKGLAGDKEVSYTVSCWAHGLQPVHDVADPYIRIKMGKTVDQTNKEPNKCFDVLFKTCPRVKAKMSERKATVELWDHNAYFSDKMKGEATIYNVETDNVVFLPMYGGAFNAPLQDQAYAMAKGAISPASTFQGWVAVMFSNRQKQPGEFMQKVHAKLCTRRLCVRLYRGLYMPDDLRGKQVSVIVTLPGGSLPVATSADQLQEMGKNANVHDMNRCLLTFPGFVSQDGVLEFRKSAHSNISDVVHDTAVEDNDNIFWVQRSTPKIYPLSMIPLDARHCYLYIVAFGEEDQPPSLFTRIRLETEQEVMAKQDIPKRAKEVHDHLSKPRWKRIRKDRSVVPLEKGGMDFGGFLLGSAFLLLEEKQEPGDFDEKKNGLVQVYNDYVTVGKDELKRKYLSQDLQSPCVHLTALAKDEFVFFSPDDSMHRGKLFPQSNMPQSIMCRPCVGEVHICSGSLGDPNEVLVGIRSPSKPRQVIYAHIDVICCRSLPATDADGLCDPCYKIQVEDQVFLSTDNEEIGIQKSLNPQFMHRLTIPVEADLDEKIEKRNSGDKDGNIVEEKDRQSNTYKGQKIPVPPIVFNLLDRDSAIDDFASIPGATFLTKAQDLFPFKTVDIGIAWVKYPDNLDMRMKDIKEANEERSAGPETHLDANRAHRAVWYELDKPNKKEWAPHVAGQDPLWRERSRLLLCAGFSAKAEVMEGQIEEAKKRNALDLIKTGAAAVSPLKVDTERMQYMKLGLISGAETRNIQITLDILGMRNCPPRMFYPELSIASYWPGKAVQIPLDHSDHINPNFQCSSYDKDQLPGFQKQVKSLVTLRATQEHEDDEDDIGEDSDNDSPATTVFIGDLLGVRLGYSALATNSKAAQPVFYEAPIIPYLQPLPLPKPKPDEAWESLTVSYGSEIARSRLYYQKTVGQRTGDKQHGAVTKQTWEELIDQPLREYGLTTKAKRRYYLKVLSCPPGTEPVQIFPFSEFRVDVIESQFPLKIKLRSAEEVKKDPVVIMPDCVFQLKSKSTGTDYGTLSMPFPFPPLEEEKDMVKSWTQISSKEYEDLEPSKKKILSFKNLSIDENAYACFIDVFAARRGYLVWDKDFYLGRNLRTPKLFTLYEDEDDPKKEKEATQKADDDDSLEAKEKQREEKLAAQRSVYPLSQFFNTEDWMLGKPEFLDNIFDERLRPVLQCARWDSEKLEFKPNRKENNAPKPRSDLFKSYLRWVSSADGLDARKRSKMIVMDHQSDLAYVSTAKLKNRLDAVNWRCTSHLVAPEYVVDKKEPAPDEYSAEDRNESLKCNQHTFMRRVGHVISLDDRDSRILCRLRMGLPTATLGDQTLIKKANSASAKLKKINENKLKHLHWHRLSEECQHESEDSKTEWSHDEREAYNTMMRQTHSKNYLTIKFDMAGTIVWASPLDNTNWQSPGTCLFCVQLRDSPTTVVPVTVPNFDLRFTAETSWFPQKTMYERWRTLQNAIRKDQDRIDQERREEELKKAEEEKGTSPGDEKEGDLKSTSSAISVRPATPKDAHGKALLPEPGGAHTYEGPSGYNRPVFVNEDAFVCRIKKRKGSNNFDRSSTNNWYRSTLRHVFPEVDRLLENRDKAEDMRMVKEMFFARLLNFRRNLAIGEHMADVGQIKGHISVSTTEAEVQPTNKNLRRKTHNSAKEKRAAERQNQQDNDQKPWYRRLIEMGQQAKEQAGKGVSSFQALVSDAPPACAQFIPLERLWVQSQINIYVYVLTASDLKLGKRTSLTPFVTAQVSGRDEMKGEVLREVNMAKQKKIDLYQVFPLSASVPGDSTLSIQLKAQDTLTSSTIGTVTVDLEDRWLALTMKSQRCLSNINYIKKMLFEDDTPGRECGTVNKKVLVVDKPGRQVDALYSRELEDRERQNLPPRSFIWPETTRTRAWLDVPQPKVKSKGAEHKDEPSGTVIKSRMGPEERMPIEIQSLYVLDDDTGTQTQAGSMRLWIDMIPETAAGDYEQADMQSFNSIFEIRVLVKGIKDISIYRDLGERNDCFVRGRLKVKDFMGRETITPKHTDVHKWATQEANFNWRWVFHVHAPAAYCELELAIEDEDIVTDYDPIYTPEVYSLDHFLMLSAFNHRDGLPNLGTLHETILFDDWPGKPGKGKSEQLPENVDPGAKKCCHRFFRTCCRCCLYRRKRKKPAKMNIDIQIIQEDDAKYDPVEEGRQGSEPKGRLGWKTLISNPGKFIDVLLGPRCKHTVIVSVVVSAIVTVLIILLMCFFYLSQGLAPILGKS